MWGRGGAGSAGRPVAGLRTAVDPHFEWLRFGAGMRLGIAVTAGTHSMDVRMGVLFESVTAFERATGPLIGVASARLASTLRVVHVACVVMDWCAWISFAMELERHESDDKPDGCEHTDLVGAPQLSLREFTSRRFPWPRTHQGSAPRVTARDFVHTVAEDTS